MKGDRLYSTAGWKKATEIFRQGSADDGPGANGPAAKMTDIPKELIPYLHRIGTEDYVTYVKSTNERQQYAPRRLATKILRFPGFESGMSLVIVVNMVIMIIETDMHAKEDVPISPHHWTEISGWIVIAIFIFELVVRLVVFGRIFFHDWWNVGDLIVVATDTTLSVLGALGGKTFSASILRMLRLAKLARVSKVIRAFPELRLLLAGLISSFSTIFWGTVLLIIALLAWSMVAVIFLNPLNKEIDYGDCERCSRAYSSVLMAAITFWQQIVAGDSWGQVSIPLLEKYPATGLIFIGVFLSVGMALINLILGVVVSVAQNAKDSLEQEEQVERALSKLDRQTHLLDLCRQMDRDNSGELSRDELYHGFDQPGEFRDSILAMDITREDFDIIWTVMDVDESGSISYKEFVNYICTMRSTDRDYMLAYIKHYITVIRNTVVQDSKKFHSQATDLEGRILEAIEALLIRRTQGMYSEKPELDDLQEIHETNGYTTDLVTAESRLFQVLDHSGTPGDEVSSQQGEKRNQKPSASFANLDGTLQNHCPRPTSIDDKRGATPVSFNDELRTLLRNLSHELETLRTDLKDTLRLTGGNLGQDAWPAIGIDLDNQSKQARLDLLAVPSQKSHRSPFCCKAPVTKPTVVKLQSCAA